MQQLGSHLTDFDDIWYMSFFRKSVENIYVLLNRISITGILYDNVSTLMKMYRFILLRMRNFLNKNYRGLPSENHTVYEIMSKNMVEPDKPQMTIWRRVSMLDK